jgi:hypothetical protein
MSGPDPLPPIPWPGWFGALEGAMVDATERAANLAVLQGVVAGVNPGASTINCGNIIDAARARLDGSNPNAAAPTTRDGSFQAIEGRFNTTLTWGSNFQAAFDAVQNGGHGTMAVVGIQYAGGGSHVVLMANQNGTVGIVEGQNWGGTNPQEVVTDANRANTRYGANSNVGWGLVGP